MVTTPSRWLIWYQRAPRMQFRFFYTGFSWPTTHCWGIDKINARNGRKLQRRTFRRVLIIGPSYLKYLKRNSNRQELKPTSLTLRPYKLNLHHPRTEISFAVVLSSASSLAPILSSKISQFSLPSNFQTHLSVQTTRWILQMTTCYPTRANFPRWGFSSMMTKYLSWQSLSYLPPYHLAARVPVKKTRWGMAWSPFSLLSSVLRKSNSPCY